MFLLRIIFALGIVTVGDIIHLSSEGYSEQATNAAITGFIMIIIGSFGWKG